MKPTPAETLRSLLAAPGCIHLPTCYDALSARLVMQSGFPVSFMSGSAVAATRLAKPDLGLVTLTEMTDQLRNICGAVPDMPVFGDGDTGNGSALNVWRTVEEYARAGAAGIMIEDQVQPKRCGHYDGKSVVPRNEARTRVRAAVEAAREFDLVVIARTDARAVNGFADAMERCADFASEGADIMFLEAPTSKEELAIFARDIPGMTMANIVPGGKTPVLSRIELDDYGFKLAVYHPLLDAAVKAMQEALRALIDDPVTARRGIGFEGMKNLIALDDYDALARKYTHVL